MISKRPSGAITSRKAAIMGTTLGASLKAGSTIEKSGGGAAMTKPSGQLRRPLLWGRPGASATARPTSARGGALLIRLCPLDITRIYCPVEFYPQQLLLSRLGATARLRTGLPSAAR